MYFSEILIDNILYTIAISHLVSGVVIMAITILGRSMVDGRNGLEIFKIVTKIYCLLLRYLLRNDIIMIFIGFYHVVFQTGEPVFVVYSSLASGYLNIPRRLGSNLCTDINPTGKLPQ